MSERQEVFKEAYEVTGETLLIKCRDHFNAKDRVTDAQWRFVKTLGGRGFRPSHNGGISSVLFAKKLPEGWRQIGTDNGMIEARPHKGTKTGREAMDKIQACARVPDDAPLLKVLGWTGNSPMYGGRIYYASITKLTMPKERFLVRVPRQLYDGFKPHALLLQIPMLDYLKAFDDHNKEAEKRRKRKK